jgi:hypothetical protein
MHELSLFVLALALGGAVAEAQETTRPASPLDPAWTWTAPAPIEWTALVPGERWLRLAVATADGKVQVISARTGEPRPVSVMQARAGLLPALLEPPISGSSPQATYCFDRYCVYRIPSDTWPRVDWRYGEAPAPGEQFAGDPEVLNAWLAARMIGYTPGAARYGVIAVNSDGRIVLLSAGHGDVEWQGNLGRLAAVRLHTLSYQRGTDAVVLFRNAGRTQAAFLDLLWQEPKPLVRELDEPWPPFSALIESGLLTVSGAEAVVWPAQGAPRRFAVSEGAAPTSPVRVALALEAVGTAPSRRFTGHRALLVGEGARLSAFRVDTGERVWSRAAVLPDGLDIATIQAWYPKVVVTGARAAVACDLMTGVQRCASKREAPFELLRAEYVDGVLCVVYRHPAREGLLELECVGASERATTQPIGPSKPLVYAIQMRDAFREVLPLGNCIALVGRDGIYAYRPGWLKGRQGAPWVAVRPDE